MPHRSQTQASRGGLNPGVLVVDDQPLVADMLAMMLASDHDVRVDTANTVDTALAAIRMAGGYATVLLDYNMPGVSGFEALHALSAENGGRVAIISGESEARLAGQALEQGACGFIPKGAGSATLGRALRVIAAGGVFMPPSHRPVGGGAHQSGKRTRRRRLIRDMLRTGMTVDEMAASLGVDQAVVAIEIGQIGKGGAT